MGHRGPAEPCREASARGAERPRGRDMRAGAAGWTAAPSGPPVPPTRAVPSRCRRPRRPRGRAPAARGGAGQAAVLAHGHLCGRAAAVLLLRHGDHVSEEPALLLPEEHLEPAAAPRGQVGAGSDPGAPPNLQHRGLGAVGPWVWKGGAACRQTTRSSPACSRLCFNLHKKSQPRVTKMMKPTQLTPHWGSVQGQGRPLSGSVSAAQRRRVPWEGCGRCRQGAACWSGRDTQALLSVATLVRCPVPSGLARTLRGQVGTPCTLWSHPCQNHTSVVGGGHPEPRGAGTPSPSVWQRVRRGLDRGSESTPNYLSNSWRVSRGGH